MGELGNANIDVGSKMRNASFGVCIALVGMIPLAIHQALHWGLMPNDAQAIVNARQSELSAWSGTYSASRGNRGSAELDIWSFEQTLPSVVGIAILCIAIGLRKGALRLIYLNWGTGKRLSTQSLMHRLILSLGICMIAICIVFCVYQFSAINYGRHQDTYVNQGSSRTVQLRSGTSVTRRIGGSEGRFQSRAVRGLYNQADAMIFIGGTGIFLLAFVLCARVAFACVRRKEQKPDEQVSQSSTLQS